MPDPLPRPTIGDGGVGLVVVGPLQILPPGDDEVISFSFVLSCFLNLALLF